MTIEDIINSFIEEREYRDNPHCLGAIFSGSYLTGLNHKDSDIDLNIIMDDSDSTSKRGNKIINGVRIEYFIRPISEYKRIASKDYNHQNSAMLSIIGHGKIVFEKDNSLTELQNFMVELYSNPMPPMEQKDVEERLSTIRSLLQEAYNLSITDSVYFNQIYHIIIEKIVHLYHHIHGISEIEPAHCYKIYNDKKYQDAYKIAMLPEPEFIQAYFELINSDLPNKMRYEKLALFFKKYVLKDINVPRKKEGEAPKNPPLNCAENGEQISIIDNKMEKLERFAKEDSPFFYHYFYFVLNRLFKYYHLRLGISKIKPLDVFGSKATQSLPEIYGIFYDEEFIRLYLELLEGNFPDKIEAFNKIKNFYMYVTRGINLGDNYEFSIKSRVKEQKKNG